MEEKSALYQKIKYAIFNPNGEQGERTLSQWQADNVLNELLKFYPHIEHVYASHTNQIQDATITYSLTEQLNELSEVMQNPENHANIDLTKLSQSLLDISEQITNELAHRDAMIKTSIQIQVAMIRLLNTNDVFIGTHWLDGLNTETRLGQPALFIHVWSYVDDSHEIPSEKILLISKLVEEFGPHATQAWVCFERGLEAPKKGDLDEGGLAALKHLREMTEAEILEDDIGLDVEDVIILPDET